MNVRKYNAVISRCFLLVFEFRVALPFDWMLPKSREPYAVSLSIPRERRDRVMPFRRAVMCEYWDKTVLKQQIKKINC